MFTEKNLSPNSLSVIAALVIALPLAIYLVAARPWIEALLVFLFVFAGSYYVIRYILHSFVYRKIKLIYKLIYQTKASKREENFYKYILPQKSLDEVSQDVQQWAEQKREEIEVLRNSEAFRREFLQNLTHEFKTPIFAVQGYVDTLLSGAVDNPDVNRRFLQNASRNITRMINLLDDLDQISSLETNTYRLQKSQFVIQDLVREVFDALSIKTAERNIKTSIKKGCEHPVAVYADKEKIREVLINLVDNAIKYGKEDGNIVASVYTTDDTTALIEIGDDGMGIAEEHLLRVFERFYRTDRGRSRDVGGTGLGLAICKHVVEAHDQTIHVRSKIDVGTTVGFTLTRAKAKA